MAEEITPPVEGTPPVDPAPALDPAPLSGLPSDAANAPIENIPAPEGQKFGGKFESTDAMLQHIKDLEDKHADARRELANKNKEIPAAEEAATADAQKVQAQADLVQNDLMPEFMANGMTITPEMEAKAKEVGIDPRDLKLGAYELKDRLNNSFEITGGQENYTAMIEWGKANLNDAQKAAFDRDLNSPMGSYAVKGLWSDFQAAGGAFTTPNGDRLRGNASPQGLQPYADRRELYKDKDYVESAAGRRDPAALKRYRDRLRITPNEVLGV